MLGRVAASFTLIRSSHAFGAELAVLGVGVRSADVTAGEEGAHGLTLTKSELMSVLEERPSVTMGLLGTLAKRIADQTEAH